MAVAIVALLAGAAPALAGPVGQRDCNDDNGRVRNICIEIGSLGSNNDWNVHVGIDISMNPDYARLLLQCGPGNIWAELWGDDGNDRHDFLKYIPLAPGWPSVGDSGLGAEFDMVVDGQVLNEDKGTDEVYATVHVWDCYSNTERYNRSANIVHGF